MSEDRGLRAVLRVRHVRERDARLGMRLALAEQAEAQRHRDRLRRALPAVPDGPGAQVAAGLAMRSVHGELAAEAGREAERAEIAAHHARDHLIAARRQAQMAQTLLDRRAARRRAEERRREQRELDDLAAQQWSRNREGSR